MRLKWKNEPFQKWAGKHPIHQWPLPQGLHPTICSLHFSVAADWNNYQCS